MSVQECSRFSWRRAMLYELQCNSYEARSNLSTSSIDHFHSSSTPKLHTEASRKQNFISTVRRFLFGKVFFIVFPVPKAFNSEKWPLSHCDSSQFERLPKKRTLSHDSKKLSRINHKVPSRKWEKNPFPQINNQKSSRSHVYKEEASHKAPPLIIFTIGCFTSFISSVARRFRLFFVPRLYAIAPVVCRDDMPSRPFVALTETPEKGLSMSVPSMCRQDLNLKKIK